MKTNDQSPFPFKRIAAAIAFSPRLEGIIAEVKRLKTAFESELILIHIGEKNDEKLAILESLFDKFGVNREKVSLFWESGDPVKRILSISKANKVDLLVTGALEKESLYSYYMGSIARKLSRESQCSLLMLTEPSVKTTNFKKIVVRAAPDSPKTENSIRTAIYFGKQVQSEQLFIVRESSLYSFAKMVTDDRSAQESKDFQKDFLSDEVKEVEKLIEGKDTGSMQVESRIVSGKPGFGVSQFAKSQKADLLVVNSPDKKLGIIDRVFPHNLEHVLAKLPCSLLIVHA
jgi:nucleotide-binding universal stress UspA family protein